MSMLEQIRTAALPYEIEAARIIDQNRGLITAAPLIVIYRRYDNIRPEVSSHRLVVITKVNTLGDFSVTQIAQMPEDVAGAVSKYVRNGRPTLVTRPWNQLSPTMRARILDSSILPIEFKRLKVMDRKPDADFALMCSVEVGGLLS